MTRVLVAGWFSAAGGEATAGDLLSMEVVRDDLAAAGCEVDVATNAGFPDGVDWRSVDADRYEALVVVCGPLHGDRLTALVDRFAGARKVAVNVSVVDRGLADRFDVVLARDDGDLVRHDLTLARRPDPVPLIGLVRAHAQPEYDGGALERAHDAIRLVTASRPCATVDFDTRVHPSADPFAAHARSPAETTSLAGRMDAVVSTRLHGMVLSLAQGTPALAVDPVPGGAKISGQAAVLDWPAVFTVDELHPEHLAEALSWCLSPEARDRAGAVAVASAQALEEVRAQVADAVTARGVPQPGR